MELLTPASENWSLLFQPSAVVTDIKTQVMPHAGEMRALCKKHAGASLAAVQVGIPLRFFVQDYESPELCAVINPEIVAVCQRGTKGREGCLSKPGEVFMVWRPAWVDVRYTNLFGDTVEEHLVGFHARCFQHEFDHLSGKTIFAP